MIYCLNRIETEPHFNIASEEYFLKEFPYDTFSVWQNNTSVIIGKHQNTAREINHQFVDEQSIPVIRRITGGGTVYHDPGNINFSFITTGHREKLVDFKKYTGPVIRFLQSVGLNAEFSGKNNITVDGIKVSGNAAHVYKDRALHHGTLLYDSDLTALNNAILGKEQLYNDKSVRSIRSRVANIRELSKIHDSTESFRGKLFRYISDSFPESIAYQLRPEDISRINEIKNERYINKYWNFGYSPEYLFRNFFVFQEENVFIKLKVFKGVIMEAKISGNGKSKTSYQLLEEKLKGISHRRSSLKSLGSDQDLTNNYSNEFLHQVSINMF